MLGYAAQRLLGVLAILAAMSFLIFAATQLLPGDVAHVILGQFATNEQIAQVQQSLGLNDPWWQQYGRWVTGVLHGDLGRSRPRCCRRSAAPPSWPAPPSASWCWQGCGSASTRPPMSGAGAIAC